jgi:hypothetical protein
LNKGLVDEKLAKSFRDRFCELPDDSSKIKVATTKPDELWLITNAVDGVIYEARVMTEPRKGKYIFIFYSSSLSVEVKAAGSEWIIRDMTNAMSYDVKRTTSEHGVGSAGLAVQQLISTMAMREQGEESINYLDIAVENKGYIYVLSSKGHDSSIVYMLDIYNPDGSVLLEKPQTGVNAAKLTVDEWRSLFTLNYECFLGPGARTEPGVSVWIPSTPGK